MKKIINTDFFLVNCDILLDLNMQEIINFHDKKKADITMVVSKENYEIPYGVCELKKNKRLKFEFFNSEWDQLFWPHAKKGFFKLKKQIKTIIKDLNQPSFNF